MSKSTSLKLYDESQSHKLTISSTNATQKISHPDQLKFKSSLSLSHNNTVETNKNFTGLVNLVRGQDASHAFVSGNLDVRIVDTEQKIADEGIAYLAHKTAIENSLTNEEARSTGATNAIAVSLNNASIARINNAATLNSKILIMTGDREQAIVDFNTHVQTGVQEIESQKTSGDAAITQRIDNLMSVGQIDKNKLMEAVTEYQAADTQQLSDIAQLQAEFNELKTRIDDVLVQESGSASSSFDVKVDGTHYAGSTFLKIRLLEPDAQLMYDTLQQGDQLKITFDSGEQEIVTFDSFSNLIPDSYYYINFTAAVTQHYFRPDVIIEII